MVLNYFIFAPLLYWALLEFRIVMEKASLADMMHNQPAVAISVIVAITDFLLGYYCWINRNKLVSNIKELKTFYVWQFFCQIFVGNIICSLLCLFGLRALQGKKIIMLLCHILRLLFLSVLFCIFFASFC